MQQPVLIIAGPDEFLADDPSAASPSPQEARLALDVHSLLRVDAGWLSPAAASWMRAAAGKIPAGYAEVSEDPVSLIKNTPAGKLGLVLFPRGSGPHYQPTLEQQAAVLRAATALKPKVSLVMGISPWGQASEQDFLPKAQGIFSCILGGGPGPAFAQAFPSGDTSLLWARSDMNGRAVLELALLQMPVSGTSAAWLDGVTFTSHLVILGPRYPSDPAMETLVGKVLP